MSSAFTNRQYAHEADDDDAPIRYDGYSLLCIVSENEEEFNVIFKYVTSNQGSMWEVRWEKHKTLLVMFSPDKIKDAKQYFDERGIDYRVDIEDVQKYYDEDVISREESDKSNCTNGLKLLNIEG